jgi:hypothetical protein
MPSPTEPIPFHSQHTPVGYLISPYAIKEQRDDHLVLESAKGAAIFMGFVFSCFGLFALAGAVMHVIQATPVLYAIAIGFFAMASYWATKTDQIEIDVKRRVIEMRSQWLGIRISTNATSFSEIEMIALRYGNLSVSSSPIYNSVRGWALEVYPRGTDAYITLNNGSNAAEMARLADAVEQLTGNPVDRSAA